MADTTNVVSTADEVRKILASAKAPLTSKEIFERCDTATEPTQVATVLHKELQDGRVERSGERGSYAYVITADGRTAAANPNALRSAKHRRTRGRGARKTSVLAKTLREAKAAPKKARKAAKASRVHVPREAPGVRPNTDDDATRLAASVLAHWPAPLKAIPTELRAQLDRALQPEVSA